MEPSRNERREERAMPRINRNFTRHAISRHDHRTRADREESASGQFPGGGISHAKAGGVQKRGWPRNSRPAIHAKEPAETRTRSHLHARRTDPADATWMALHAVLPQRLRDESISGQRRLHRAFGELPAWNYVRPRIS